MLQGRRSAFSFQALCQCDLYGVISSSSLHSHLVSHETDFNSDPDAGIAGILSLTYGWRTTGTYESAASERRVAQAGNGNRIKIGTGTCGCETSM